MPLPKLNTPEYSLNVPSSDEEIKFRPFVVAEEKLLLIAQETGDEAAMLAAVKKIVEGCTFNALDVEHMPLFDLEYIFLKIRSKSVGETSTIRVKCKDGKNFAQVDIPLDGIVFKTDMHLTISNVTSVTFFVTPITADTDNG